MAVGEVDIWGEVRRLRVEFAGEIERLSADQWDLPSWCAGWRIRDVLGHLVSNAEENQLSFVWETLRSGVRPDRAVDRLARGLGARPVPDLVDRLRRAADGRFRVVGVPSELGLGDLLVHGADALRPLGVMLDPPVPDVVLVLDTYRKWGRRLVHAVPHRGVTLVATDVDWRAGAGPEVRGRAIDLLLLVANRRQVVDRLVGPGLPRLAL